MTDLADFLASEPVAIRRIGNCSTCGKRRRLIVLVTATQSHVICLTCHAADDADVRVADYPLPAWEDALGRSEPVLGHLRATPSEGNTP
jgi:hypothetical protein